MQGHSNWEAELKRGGGSQQRPHIFAMGSSILMEGGYTNGEEASQLKEDKVSKIRRRRHSKESPRQFAINIINKGSSCIFKHRSPHILKRESTHCLKKAMARRDDSAKSIGSGEQSMAYIPHCPWVTLLKSLNNILFAMYNELRKRPFQRLQHARGSLPDGGKMTKILTGHVVKVDDVRKSK